MAAEEFVIAGGMLFLFVIVASCFALAIELTKGTPIDNQFSQPMQGFFDNLDKLVILLSFILHIGILVFAFLFPTHPVYALGGFIMCLFAIFIVGNMFTILDNVLSTPTFSILQATPGLRAYAQVQPFMTIGFSLAFFVIAFGRPGQAGGRLGA